MINFGGFEDMRMVRTSSACPEQYEVFINDRPAGYIRLRHGQFRVDYPECGGDTIFESDEVNADGCFAGDEAERARYLGRALDNILRRWSVESAQPATPAQDVNLAFRELCGDLAFAKNHATPAPEFDRVGYPLHYPQPATPVVTPINDSEEKCSKCGSPVFFEENGYGQVFGTCTVCHYQWIDDELDEDGVPYNKPENEEAQHASEVYQLEQCLQLEHAKAQRLEDRITPLVEAVVYLLAQFSDPKLDDIRKALAATPEHECNDCGDMIPDHLEICAMCESWYEERGLDSQQERIKANLIRKAAAAQDQPAAVEPLKASDCCSWCNTDPIDAERQHEGPHATWCVHFK